MKELQKAGTNYTYHMYMYMYTAWVLKSGTGIKPVRTMTVSHQTISTHYCYMATQVGISVQPGSPKVSQHEITYTSCLCLLAVNTHVHWLAHCCHIPFFTYSMQCGTALRYHILAQCSLWRLSGHLNRSDKHSCFGRATFLPCNEQRKKSVEIGSKTACIS